MSRIGKKIILIPEKVTVKIEGNKITVSGPKGEMSVDIRSEIKAEIQDNNVVFSIQKETDNSNAFWGLYRSLVANMVKGVVKEFEKKLELDGLGYRGAVEGDSLVLQLGFSHPIKIKKPEGINFTVEKNVIIVSGIDKGLVTQTASIIRKLKPCEPYKGKGIKYEGEKIRRKAGKRVVSGS
jgi:large subunit ribosomal protein L6